MASVQEINSERICPGRKCEREVSTNVNKQSVQSTLILVPLASQHGQQELICMANGESMKEEDIDPFTYYPPFTKWDYLKVFYVNIFFYKQ